MRGISRRGFGETLRRMNRRGFARRRAVLLVLCLLSLESCSRPRMRVAVIPQTTGVTIWEAEHAGAEFAAKKSDIQIYWNAPTSEDDIQQQGSLVEKIIDERYTALILAPDQTIALMAPVQRALSHGIRTVVVGSPLTLPPSRDLSYIVNNDQASGRLAAMRIGHILHGKGRVAVLGVTAESLSSVAILHSFETTLEQHFPDIVIAERRFASHNGPEARQVADEVLSTDQSLDAIFTLSAASSNGTFMALQSRGLTARIRLIGFEQNAELANLVRLGTIDSLIAENTYEMGYRAIELLNSPPQASPQAIELEPSLLTIENIDSPSVRTLVNIDWSRK
jgi:ribose transport system substrate-binding protein